MLGAAALAAALSWAGEAAVETYLFHHGGMLDQVFTADPAEQWDRGCVAALILALGVLAAIALSQRERALQGLRTFAADLAAANLELAQEVAERTRIAEELRQANQSLHAIIAASPLAILALDAGGRVHNWNPAAESIFGWTAEEVIGQPLPFVPVAKREESKGLVSRVIGGESISGLRLERQRKDGALIDISLFAGPLRDAEGRITGIVAAVADVTERRRMEDALKRSEEDYRTLAGNLPGIVYRVHLGEGRTQFFNDQLQALLGYDPAELSPGAISPLEPLVLADDREALATAVERAVAQKTPFEVQYRLRRKDGTVRTMIDRGQPLAGSDGAPCLLDGVIFDITERIDAAAELRVAYESLEQMNEELEAEIGERSSVEEELRITNTELSGLNTQLEEEIEERARAQQALRDSERRFRQMIENISDVISVIDEQGTALYYSPSVEHVLGYAPEELAGEDSFSLVHPADLAGVKQALVRSSQEAQHPALFECRYRHSDGRWRCMQSRIQLMTEAGAPPAYIVSSRDVTEQRHAEELRQRLAAAVEQVADMIIVTDARGRIQYVNAAFERVTGYDCAGLAGLTPRVLKSGRQDEEFYVELWETIQGGNAWSGHLLNRKKDGALYEVESSISPLRDKSGRIVNFVAVQRDVTQVAALEAQLLQAQKMEAVGQMAGGIAHDFNNLLTAVVGNLSLAELLEPADPERGNRLREASAAAARCADLTRRLLLFSRPSPGAFSTISVNASVNSALELARHSISSSITLEVELDERDPQINADATQLHQVLMNLLINARDATTAGGAITMRTQIVQLTESDFEALPPGRAGMFARLDVADTGAGMAQETLERIFEPFFTTKPAGEGTGLGLAIVYGIVKQHRGWVAVDSQIGQGSCFSVYLPLAGSRAAAAPALAQPLPGSGETVLVVDDEEAVTDIAAQILQNYGYTVEVARDGTGALNIMREQGRAIALVILDIEMPGLSGMETWRRICELSPGTRVMFCSGTAPSAELRSQLQARGGLFLAKPFTASRLLDVVRQVLDAK